MSNTASLKRKAQQLVQKKAYADAIEQYTKLVESGEMEPYDFVVFGDLLLRTGDLIGAVERYVEAMGSYSEAGLHRSAIALAKKVVRLAPQRVVIHRRLGDLYASEGLANEACTHYIDYLEKVDRDSDDALNNIEEVCIRVLSLPLPSFDLVDRIVNVANEVARGETLAASVFYQATQAGQSGDTKAEERLTKLAFQLNPDMDASEVVSPPQPDTREMRLRAEARDPGDIVLREEPAVHEIDVEEPSSRGRGVEEPPVLSLDDDYEEQTDFGMVRIEEEAEPEYVIDVEETRVETPAPRPAKPAPAEPAEEEEPVEAAPQEDPDELFQRAQTFVQQGEPTRAQREYMRAARAFFELAKSAKAAEMYQRVVEMDPNHLEALRGLVEIAHINGERGKMAHWGCELGDVLLARAMYGEAKLQFERVLAFDPGNSKATARVARLKNMGGVEDVNFGDLRPVRSEVQGARVDIKEEKKSDSEETQSLFDLSQILDEFHSSVVEQIPAEDSQSHYDLGMAYKEMGLWQEATEEFETAAESQENRPGCLEMLAECYVHLDRHEEAVSILEDLVRMTEGDSEARLYVKMGRAYESMEKWDEAETAYGLALEIDPKLAEATELLEGLEQRRDRGAA